MSSYLNKIAKMVEISPELTLTVYNPGGRIDLRCVTNGEHVLLFTNFNEHKLRPSQLMMASINE